ncbi:MAG: response regulator [Planctomycetes bacterium]|nr:response regulator [Planctomycetota bacterium]
MSAVEPATSVLISRDLFFTSKVTGTAQALGISLRVVGSVAQALELVAERPCPCVLVDLADPGLDVTQLVQQLPSAPGPRVVAFGSHVATARLEEARSAGCTEVLPRSRFSAELPELLKKYAGGSSHAAPT